MILRDPRIICAVFALAGALAGAPVSADVELAAGLAPAHLALPQSQPAARWDGRPGADTWTQSTLAAVTASTPDMAEVIPLDIVDWCPGYASAAAPQRREFWVGLISALVHHESFYNPRNVSSGGQWFGLIQIYPPTARFFGCDVRSGDALLDPDANLVCAVRIMSQAVADWPSISVDNGRWRGVAAQWGPMTQTRKREDMMAWTTAQDYCQFDGRLALNAARMSLPALQ